MRGPRSNLLLIALCACAAVLPPAARAQTESSSADSRLTQIIQEFDRLHREADPMRAAQEGDRTALRRLPDVSRQAEQTRLHTLNGLREQLAGVNAEQLSPAAALNHALLTYLIGQRIEETTLDLNRIAFQSSSGFYTLPVYLGRSTTIASRDDAEAWLTRLAALPAYYQQNIENLRRGIRTRYTQPRMVVDRVLEVARKQAMSSADESPLLAPFARMPQSIPQDAQRDLRNKALGLIRDGVLPAQKRFVEFLEKEYVPAARRAQGWRSMPGGEATYRFLVRRETTSDLTPEQVHKLGVAEVKRIRSEMEKTIRESGFTGTFADFLQMLRTDSRFYASSSQQLIERASEISKRIDGQLPRLFSTLPRLPFTIQPFPSEVAEGAPTGQYMAGSVQLGRPGNYMVNTSHLEQRPLYELPALTLHEAAPGHHLQIALTQELRDLPYFRRNMGLAAFVEGWGLYAESLGEEMGVYRDPYERFGRYSYEIWRACRLVADTGIHWLGWDIEQARRCFTDNSSLTAHNIQTELERYVSWPAQALSYKVGELEFRELRQVGQQELGERFDVRAFHDQLLSTGPLPLNVLDRRMRDWIRVQVATRG
jgi:uncharacterized protein (DUF885 family)